MGKWSDITYWYKTYEQANWVFAARTMSVALFGMAAQINPPKMTGCIYMFSAFWILCIVTNYCDIVYQYWAFAGLGFSNVDSVDMNTQYYSFPNYVILVFNCLALHQTWAVAYPANEVLDYNKKTHKNPMISKVFGWICIIFAFMFSVMMWWMPDDKNFFEVFYNRWKIQSEWTAMPSMPAGYGWNPATFAVS